MNELAGAPTYYSDINQQQCLNATKHTKVKTKGSFLYAMKVQNLCREDFAVLNGLKVRTITRHGTDVTTLLATLLYDKRHNQPHMGKSQLSRKMLDLFPTT